MKKITIKMADGTRYDLPPRENLDVVEKFGMWFLKIESDDATRFINCQNIASITEKFDER